MDKIIKINNNSIRVLEKIISIEKTNNKTFLNTLTSECILREIIEGFLVLKKNIMFFLRLL